MNQGRSARFDAIRYIVPNVITMAGLCVGLTGIYFATQGRWERAVHAVVIAGVLDIFDGAIARLLHAKTAIGAQLDSLCDVVCFGVVPSVIAYLWSTHQLGIQGWITVVFFCAAAAFRLALFNVVGSRDTDTRSRYVFFQGLPITMAAAFMTIPMMLFFETGRPLFISPVLNGVNALVLAVLMVSRFPTLSLKQLASAGRTLRAVAMVLVVLLVVGMFIKLWVVLIGLGVVYALSIPLGIVMFLVERRKTT